MPEETIHSLVREREDTYTTGTTKLGKYVDYSMYDTIETIDAYVNSKHTSGLYDSHGNEKPFFNIVTSAVNIWYHATDIDRKNIRIKATKSADILPAFLATVWIQNWMRENVWGKFLNEWGRTLAKYGSAVVKFVERDGKLYSSVIPWNRLIVDPVSFDGGLVIEKLYYTPSQLRRQDGYGKDMVEELISAQSTRKTLGEETVDTNDDYIEIYEVHGELPVSYLDESGDDYTQQVHVVSYVKTEDGFEDFTLYKGREDNPYYKTDLIEEDGRTLSIGAVESLFDAQWMRNHTMKAMKDQLDLASKLIFQTADSSFVGRNVLTAIENGDILIHGENKPLTQINNGSHDITSLQSFAREWDIMAQQTTNTPDLTRGQQLPSGTTLGEVQIIQDQTTSLFKLMVENKGLDLERMLREKVIPHAIKDIKKNSDEIMAVLEAHDIAWLDRKFIPAEVARRFNDSVIENVLSGKVEMPDIGQLQNEVTGQMQELGNTRYFRPSDVSKKVWGEIFKDLEWDVEVEITDETVDKAAVFGSLNTVLQIMARPDIGQLMENPQFKTVLTKILEETGKISAAELSAPSAQAPQGQVGGAQRLPEVTGQEPANVNKK